MVLGKWYMEGRHTTSLTIGSYTGTLNSSAPQCHTFPSGLYVNLMPLQTRQYSNTNVEKKKKKVHQKKKDFKDKLLVFTHLDNFSSKHPQRTNAIQLSHGLWTPTGYSKSSLQWELNIVAPLKLTALLVWEFLNAPLVPVKVLAPAWWQIANDGTSFVLWKEMCTCASSCLKKLASQLELHVLQYKLWTNLGAYK